MAVTQNLLQDLDIKFDLHQINILLFNIPSYFTLTDSGYTKL
jgi:hypothetical protein